MSVPNPVVCGDCGKTDFRLTCVDIEDDLWLCRKCKRAYDNDPIVRAQRDHDEAMLCQEQGETWI